MIRTVLVEVSGSLELYYVPSGERVKWDSTSVPTEHILSFLVNSELELSNSKLASLLFVLQGQRGSHKCGVKDKISSMWFL